MFLSTLPLTFCLNCLFFTLSRIIIKDNACSVPTRVTIFSPEEMHTRIPMKFRALVFDGREPREKSLSKDEIQQKAQSMSDV